MEIPDQFENRPEDPNALILTARKRLRADPWNGGKITDVGNQVTGPTPVDFAGRKYTDQNFKIGQDGIQDLRRDALIESILELDSSKNEYVKRLILENRRLDVLMKLLGYRAPVHQLVLNDFLSSRQFGLILAPRGSGKSTSCNIAYAILKALLNRNIRILIASRTVEQAKSFLFEIKSNLMKESLVNIFGELRGDKWDETQADIIGRTQHTKEHTFTIAGADGAVVSKHFDEIICDDIVEESNSRTEGQRKKLRVFFDKSLFPTLRPEGLLRVIGTRYNPEDFYGHLWNNNPLFKNNCFVLPAIFNRENGEAIDLEQDDDGKFYAPLGATCYDPVGFPMKRIIQRRTSMALADFECQYQNRTQFMSGDYFNSDWFKYYDDNPKVMSDRMKLSVWMGVDLASSLKDSADEFAIVVIGILNNMVECYILETFAGRLTFNKQKKIMENMFDKWDPVRTFVEANAYQSILEATVKEEFPAIRSIPVYTTKDKGTRAKALQAYYEHGQIYHRKGRMGKLEGQLVGFPDIKLKDLFDAEFLAINGALQGGARKRRKKEDEPGLF